MLRCERIETALRDRVWTIPAGTRERHWSGLLLQSGAALIEDRESQSWLDPSMVFLAATDLTRSLRILAGSEGLLFSFGQQQASAVIGHGADGEALFSLLENRVLVRLDQGDIALQEAEFALGLLMNGDRDRAPGRETLSEAALKIILVALLRNLPASFSTHRRTDRSSQLLQRFRHLLEARFRDRWSVARYAEDLRISPDRLHDLCTSKLNRSPSDLIAERTDYEAKVLLQNAPVSVSEISDRLGFKDPSHFSRFFARRNTESPRAFRRRIHHSRQSGQVAPINFSDWP